MGLGFELFAEALPSDVRPVRFVANEGVSRPFRVEVSFDTQDAAFTLDDLLFARLAVSATDAAGMQRVFDGIVEEVAFEAVVGSALRFRAVTMPRVAALRHRVDSRIFQEQSVVDVVKAILGEAGMADSSEWRVMAEYEKRDYIVQYAESQLAFISRLLEEEGIFFFFEHDPDGHKLVFGDHDGAFTEPEKPVVLSRGQAGGGNSVLALERVAKLAPSHAHLRDYDVKQPAVPPEAVGPAEAPVPIGHYSFPGGFTTGAAATRKATARIKSLRAEADVLRGRSSAVGLLPGHRVSFDGFPEGAIPAVCTVIETTIIGEQASERAGVGSPASTTTTFTAIPRDTPWAPPRVTPKPRIRGYQVATVMGPTDEQETIHTDELGRIKVRFPWDRSGIKDDKTSTWVRVSQMMLGGAMILPRVGWEVAVSFEHGDPDRPLVIGKVYTAEEPPPEGLPGAAANASFSTRSSPGGAGRNGITLGDSGGSQGFGVTSQKDQNTGIGNDRTVTIGANEKVSVGANANLMVKGDESITVGGNQSVNIGDALQVKIQGAQTVAVGGSETFGSTKDFVEHAGGSYDLIIGGGSTTICNGIRIKATGAATREVASAMVTLSAGAITDVSSADCSETIGAVALTLAAGSVVESIKGAKETTSLAAELLMGTSLAQSGASIQNLIGGLHMRKIGGDITFKAPTIAIGGAMGTFKAGGSSVKLAGGPITIKASSFKYSGPALIKTSGSLKQG